MSSSWCRRKPHLLLLFLILLAHLLPVFLCERTPGELDPADQGTPAPDLGVQNSSFIGGFLEEGASSWARFLVSNAQLEHLFWGTHFPDLPTYFENAGTREGRDPSSPHPSPAEAEVEPEQGGSEKVSLMVLRPFFAVISKYFDFWTHPQHIFT